MIQPVLKSLAFAMLAVSALAAHAADANVTNAVIAGTGIGNNDFTIGTGLGIGESRIELGLRARERYGGPGPIFSPTNNTYNNDTNTYNHAAGGFTPIPATPNGTSPGPRASWNFDWSINSNQTGSTTGPNVGAYTYLLSLDTDPGVAINYFTFNPVNGTTTCSDNSFGNNGTAQGAGVEVSGTTNVPNGKCNAANSVADTAQYGQLLAANNLVQNSYNYAFFPSSFAFNPNTTGTYTIMLQAFNSDGGDALATSLINVNVAAVPEPGSMALVGLALAGLAVVRRRKV